MFKLFVAKVTPKLFGFSFKVWIYIEQKKKEVWPFHDNVFIYGIHGYVANLTILS